jgi:nitrate/nitrite-specific signal transduction histidine kinase
MATAAAKTRERARGKLKIGDDWNAITIIALSQSNPLKAIAELVENSIDAKASSVNITRGREHGRHFLAIQDNGEGVPRDSDGRPDFHYVATHIPAGRYADLKRDARLQKIFFADFRNRCAETFQCGNHAGGVGLRGADP